MSRVLKFRIWDKANKEYKILGATGLDARNGDVIDYYNEGNRLGGPEEYDVEQYTGLKDKNGKEIYEGDIVKAKIDGFWQTGAYTVSEGKATWNLEVVYNDIRYMDVFHILGSKSQPNRIYYLFDESISDIEVIGNIHENKELWSESV